MKKRKKGSLLIRMGLLLIVAAFALAGFNLLDDFRAEKEALEIIAPLEAAMGTASTAQPSANITASVQGIVEDNPKNPSAAEAFPENLPAVEDFPMNPLAVDVPREVEIPDYILNPDMDMPVSRQNGQDYIGILEIPALELKLPVISEWNYPRLRIAPCRYSGSAYKNNLVISAHNYAAHFGYLKKLDGGERVIFTDTDGNRFDYRVELHETLNPRDIDGMINGGWDLTLFTCTPGGSYRMAVRCMRMNNI